ncbi:hypothetical protein R1sor_020363 [Riccia sorocarpa]|uniref:Enhancer of polycomb-like protein n=1 Tax=Riccia sorocarpa TaxID=122646 RepID=A0ABD3IJF9_9MARC
MSRLSFRPRPLDIHKKLPIVKSVKDLDSDEGPGVSRTVHHNHIALDAENELVLSTPTRRGGAEIPTPEFLVVESYEKDYTRTFNQPPSYLRGRGARTEATEYVEYDLDDEDEDWLNQLNAERRILSPERFEGMLYRLEIMDHKTRERTGGVPATLGTAVPVQLSREAAMDALRAQSSRQAVLTAVYDFWKSKRDRWQKPILRRLQPPPPVNDTNPFNVFRPRERAHRPHTRRMQRRENDVASFEKLRQVRLNLEQSRNLMLCLQKREEKKRELVECEANLQRIQLRIKHDARLDDEGLLATNTSMAQPGRKAVPSKRLEDGPGFLQRCGSGVGAPDHADEHGVSIRPPTEGPTAGDAATGDQIDRLKNKRKRRRVPVPRGRPRRMKVIDSLEPVLLFTKPLDSEKLTAAGIIPPREPPVENGVTESPYQFHGRVGRGGRIIFDRWNPLTRTPIGSPSVAPLTSSFRPPPTAERFRAPPPPRLDIPATTPLNTLSTTPVAGVVEHTSSTKAPPA